MPKTQITLDLETAIWKATAKMGVFGCFEVTIGWSGNERVDYLTYDTKGIWRCYEIKATKADFHSSAFKTFIGHYNYYVLTRELYEQVKDEIPSDIGVCIYKELVKRPRRRELAIVESILYQSMIRSLYRYADAQIKSGTPSIVERYKRENEQLMRQNRQLHISQYGNELELRMRRRADIRGEKFDAEAFEKEMELYI